MSIEEKLQELAALSPMEYESRRKDEAKQLGIDRVKVLDDEVTRRRPKGEGEARGGHKLKLPTDVDERVKKIVLEHLGVEESKVVDNASFIDDLGADSLDTVELVMAFEEEFNCEISDDAAEKILTVKDAIDYINTQTS